MTSDKKTYNTTEIIGNFLDFLGSHSITEVIEAVDNRDERLFLKEKEIEYEQTSNNN